MKIYSNYLPIERYEKFILSQDRFKNLPITIFNDYFTKNNWKELEENPINIIILNEPNQLFGHHDYVQKVKNNYSLILTWSQDVVDKCSNAKKFIHGETNLDLDYINSFYFRDERLFEVTFLSGVLELIEGHKLRQKVLQIENDLCIPVKFWKVLSDFNHETGNRPGYRDPGAEIITEKGTPIEGEGKKEIWNRKSMFHIAIENSRNLNYYTDKIVDCFATKTIPIYWGAPNIADYFNKEGIITFENEEDLKEILNNLTERDYINRLEAIEENYILARENGFFFERLTHTLDEIVKLNNIK
jgi:hypothetical protein|tara:strand:+ start:1190 stop:2092 length:903 start_codon:yes stop_codon:yes gene_type:complete